MIVSKIFLSNAFFLRLNTNAKICSSNHMDNAPAFGAVGSGFDSESGQIDDFEIGIHRLLH